MSKSRFYAGTRGNGRWDEEEHPRGKDGRFAVAGSSSITEPKPNDDHKTSRMREKLKAMKDGNAKIRAEIEERKARLEKLKGSTRLSDVAERVKVRSGLISRQIQMNRARWADELNGDARRHAISRFEKSYGKGSFNRTLGK